MRPCPRPRRSSSLTSGEPDPSYPASSPAVTHNYTKLDNIKGDDKRRRVGGVVARANETIANYKHELRKMEKYAYDNQEGASRSHFPPPPSSCTDSNVARLQTTPTSAPSRPSPSSSRTSSSPPRPACRSRRRGWQFPLDGRFLCVQSNAVVPASPLRSCNERRRERGALEERVSPCSPSQPTPPAICSLAV